MSCLFSTTALSPVFDDHSDSPTLSLGEGIIGGKINIGGKSMNTNSGLILKYRMLT